MTVLLWPDSMTEEDRQEERRSGRDRRETSSSFDPRFWVSLSAVLLTIGLAVLGYISSQLSTINSNVQAIVIASTKQGTEIEQLKRDVQNLQNFKDTQDQINRMYEGRIVKIEAKQK